MGWVGAAVVSFIGALVLMPATIVALRHKQLLDHPNHRSSHTRPTVRGGGLAIAMAAVITAALTADVNGIDSVALMAGAAALAVVGAADDFTSGLPAMARLIAQSGIALLAAVLLVTDEPIAAPAILALTVIAVAWIVAYVNAFNFMDGINGIAAGQAIVAGAALAAVGAAEDIGLLTAGGAIVAAATLAFAPFNFPTARIFLGDVGSYFLGGWLAILAVIAVTEGATPEAALAPFALYGADTAVTLIRRIRRGDPWYEAHREHTYQQLVASGWSHTRTTLTVTVVIAASSLLGYLTLDAGWPLRLAADAGIVALTLAYLALPAARQRAHRRGAGRRPPLTQPRQAKG